MQRISRWAAERSAPLVATVWTLVGVMAFSVLSHSALHGGPVKLEYAPDLWSLAASSLFILHGQFAHIYSHGSALTSPPALEFVLAPVLWLGHLVGLAPHLHVRGEPLSMWFVLAPAAVLLASSALFALDAVARHWQFSERARLGLALAGGVGIANVVAGWGHPEDCVALAFVVWAALALERRGSSGARQAALLLGIGIAFQPLAILGVVPVLCRLKGREALAVSWRLGAPSLAVLAAPLLAETHETLWVIVRQPFVPRFISFTPLTHWAPVIAPGVDGGGPTRLLATVLSMVLALVVCRRRHDLATVLSVTAFAYFLRVLFETELNWYYLWPIPALCLLLALRRGRARFCVCVAALLLSIVLGDHRVHQIVWWWPALMTTLLVMLATAALPRRVRVAHRAPTARRVRQPVPT
jgi:hypothetical protein